MKRRDFLESSATLGLSAAITPLRRGDADQSRRAAVPHNHQGSYTIATKDGVRLFCRDWGAGHPIVFVHGWAVSSELWRYQMFPLSNQGLRCIAYDKRGHGQSSDPGGGYDYDRFADDLAALLDQLDLHDVTLVGHSMGPGEIARYLSRHGGARIARLVFISTATPYLAKAADNPDGIDPSAFESRRKSWMKDFPAWLASNARAYLTQDTSTETVSWVAELGLQASFKAVFETNRAIAETDLRSDVARIALPTLIIHGDGDKLAPSDLTARKTAALIRGSQLKLYAGAPHGLIVTHQEQLNADLSAWVARGADVRHGG